LLQAIQAKAFRQDLYYRLNVVGLSLPPLRDRREDLSELIAHFLERYCHELKRDQLSVDPDAMEVLLAHPWPGNVRELQNVIERAVVLCQGPMITQADLPAELRGQFSAVRNSSLQSVGIDPALPLAEAVEVFKRTRIQAVLESVSGNQTQAAQLLGLPRSNLSRLMKRLRLRQ
jgi:DNA-binding NtrC family response regulator